jgi:predicted GIY-YIG superfamily endonuclease
MKMGEDLYERIPKEVNKESILNSDDVRKLIFGTVDAINKYIKSIGVKNNWMYFQESFTGLSHYLSTKDGKIRISDHPVGSKGEKYSKPIKNIVICEGMDKKEAANEVNSLISFIKKMKKEKFNYENNV